MNPLQDDSHMRRALELAEAAAAAGEIPVGCVIARGAEVVGEGSNLREAAADPTAHAEVIAIRKAASVLGRWRLADCTLYVTLEPCFMCAGAIVLSRIPRVVYAARDPKAGAAGSLANVLQDPRLNHRCAVDQGCMADAASDMLRSFFRDRRRKPT